MRLPHQVRNRRMWSCRRNCFQCWLRDSSYVSCSLSTTLKLWSIYRRAHSNDIDLKKAHPSCRQCERVLHVCIRAFIIMLVKHVCAELYQICCIALKRAISSCLKCVFARSCNFSEGGLSDLCSLLSSLCNWAICALCSALFAIERFVVLFAQLECFAL